MTPTKTLLLGLSAASFILLSGCAREATDSSMRDDSAMNDTAPSTTPAPSDTYSVPADTYGTPPESTAPGATTDPNTAPSSDPNAIGSEQGGTTAPDTTNPPQ